MVETGRCEVRLTRRYAAAPAEVWRALTEPESLARWLRPGFAVEPAVVEDQRVLELAWRPPGEDESLVRFELRPDGDATVLVVDHRRIEEPRGMYAMTYWTAALGRLPRAFA